jgi:hypothetical protein
MRLAQLTESNTATNIAVFYGGRFQPMHLGHKELYNSLTNKFGSSNVFIATTFGEKQQRLHATEDYSTDPFTFEEKKRIISGMFGISQQHIVDTQPYKPDVTKVNRDPETTVVVLAFSEKDAGRLKPSDTMVELPIDMKNLRPVSSGIVYFTSLPIYKDGMSASDFRAVMSGEDSIEEKKKAFVEFFGKMNDSLFDFIFKRMTDE